MIRREEREIRIIKGAPVYSIALGTGDGMAWLEPYTLIGFLVESYTLFTQ
jgi:hypothetical protein